MLSNESKISLINIYKKYVETIYNRVLLRINKKKVHIKKENKPIDDITLLEELLKEFKEEKENLLTNFEKEKEKLLQEKEKNNE